MDSLSKRVLTTILLLSMVVWFTAIEGELVLVDVLSRYVVLYDTPRRVVVLAPSITEMLAYLNVDDTIIGADAFSLNSWFMDVGSRLSARNVTSVGGYWWTAVSVEKILELQPDIVLADVGAHRPLLETFEANNVTVFYLHGGSARTVYDVYADIHMLGLLFNRQDRAGELIEAIEREIAEKRGLFEKVGYTGLKVLIVIDFWGGIWVSGRATYIDDVVSRLGLVNAAEVYSWSLVSIEQVASWNPDVIIVACGYATEETVRESGLYELGKPILIMNSTEIDIISRPGPLLMYVPGVLYSALQHVVEPRYPHITVETPTPSTGTEAVERQPETKQEATRTETPAVPREGLKPWPAIAVAVAALAGGLIGYVVGHRLRR